MLLIQRYNILIIYISKGIVKPFAYRLHRLDISMASGDKSFDFVFFSNWLASGDPILWDTAR